MVINRELIRQIFFFGCVGVTATLVHYFVALGGVTYISINVYLANLVGYVSAVLVSLFGHSHFTYKKRLNAVVARRFVIVSLSTLGATQIILAVLRELFSLSEAVALAIVVITVPAVTFVLNKTWVFAASHEDIQKSV